MPDSRLSEGLLVMLLRGDAGDVHLPSSILAISEKKDKGRRVPAPRPSLAGSWGDVCPPLHRGLRVGVGSVPAPRLAFKRGAESGAVLGRGLQEREEGSG